MQVRELHINSKIKTIINTNGKEKEEIIVYRGMDGLYGKFETENGDFVFAGGEVKKKGDYYVFG